MHLINKKMINFQKFTHKENNKFNFGSDNEKSY